MSRKAFTRFQLRPAASIAVCFWVMAAPHAAVQAASTGTESGAVGDVRAVEEKLLQQAARNIEECRKGHAAIRVQTAQGEPLNKARVEVRQVGHEFLFGCIIFDLVWSREPYKPELFRERFKDLFNFAVFPFYWSRYESRPGETMRDATVDVLQWCTANGITCKGHPLVWTNRSGVPDWVAELSVAESQNRLLERVRREVGGFRGQIDIWDVVNEPVNCRTWENVEARDYIHEPIGPIADYVEEAFRAAHQANPDAVLILNEYNTIARPEVRERFFELASELKRCGAPLSGLGIQAHEPRERWYPPAEVWATLDRLGGIGYPLHITEFIPQSGGKEITGGWRTGQWNEQTQAEFAEQMFRLAFGHPSVASINWWGFSDRRIWLPGGGLVTDEYKPKPVYNRLRKLLWSEWNTRLDLTTDQEGGARFRGFHGRYSVKVTGKGHDPQTFRAVLSKEGNNRWDFRLGSAEK